MGLVLIQGILHGVSRFLLAAPILRQPHPTYLLLSM